MADLGGDPAVMQELVDTFLDEGAKMVPQLRSALAAGDRRTLDRIAHSMKSTSATFGAMDLSHMCRNLEADSERAIPADAEPRVAAIVAEWDRVRAGSVAWRS